MSNIKFEFVPDAEELMENLVSQSVEEKLEEGLFPVLCPNCNTLLFSSPGNAQCLNCGHQFEVVLPEE